MLGAESVMTVLIAKGESAGKNIALLDEREKSYQGKGRLSPVPNRSLVVEVAKTFWGRVARSRRSLNPPDGWRLGFEREIEISRGVSVVPTENRACDLERSRARLRQTSPQGRTFDCRKHDGLKKSPASGRLIDGRPRVPANFCRSSPMAFQDPLTRAQWARCPPVDRPHEAFFLPVRAPPRSMEHRRWCARCVARRSRD